MLVLDFDGVLFNDERFKRDHRRVFERCGVPHRVYRAAYEETKARMRGGYRHDVHAALIRRELPRLNRARLEREITELLGRSHRYLYRDALPFLKYWKNKGETLILASRGYQFQKKKVAESGIGPLFDEIVVRDIPKSKIIKRFIRRFRPRRIVFIDDTGSVLDEVKLRIPQALALQIVRRNGQARSDRADAVLRSIAAAQRIIPK